MVDLIDEKHWCVISLNLDPMDQVSFKDFPIFSSGGHFLFWGGGGGGGGGRGTEQNFLTVLVEGLMRNIWVKLF